MEAAVQPLTSPSLRSPVCSLALTDSFRRHSRADGRRVSANDVPRDSAEPPPSGSGARVTAEAAGPEVVSHSTGRLGLAAE